MDCELIAALIVFVILLIIHVGRAQSNYDRKFVRKTYIGLDLAGTAAAEAELARRTSPAPPGTYTTPTYTSVQGVATPIAPSPLAPSPSAAPLGPAPQGVQVTQSGTPMALVTFTPTPSPAPTNQSVQLVNQNAQPVLNVQVTPSPAPAATVPFYPRPPATGRSVVDAPTEVEAAVPASIPSAPLVVDTQRAKKKGFVAGTSDPTCAAKIAALNCDWYYTWGSTPPKVGPPGLLFTPMYWSIANAPASALASFNVNNVPPGWDPINLLTYNEPDGNAPGAQANMTPDAAAAKWPDIVATGRRLGSPVMAGSLIHSDTSPTNVPPPGGWPAPSMVNISNDPNAPNLVSLDPSIWLDNFLIKINLQTPRPRNPDFVCVHWYGPPQADSLLNYLTAINNKYRLPIWVTEYSCADWPATCCGGNPPGTVHSTSTTYTWDTFSGTPIDAAQNSTANFMQQTVQGMEAMPFVEKYSWKERFKLVPFTNPTGIQGDSPEAPNNPDHMNQSALFDSYVHFPATLPPLTPLGTLYASF